MKEFYCKKCGLVFGVKDITIQMTCPYCEEIVKWAFR